MADPTPSDLRARLLGMIADWEAEIKADRLVPEVDRDPHFVNIREHDIARMKAALSALPAAGGVTLDEAERQTIETLLNLAHAAWCLADSTEDSGGDGLTIERSDFAVLETHLDALAALPNDQPGYTMGEAAKARWALRRLLTTTPPPDAAIPDDATNSEVVQQFLHIARTMKPVGQWPGERVCLAIERMIYGSRDFIAQVDKAPYRGHNGRGGDAPQPLPPYRSAAAVGAQGEWPMFTWSGLAPRKLGELRKQGWAVNGYALYRNGERGLIDLHGAVHWIAAPAAGKGVDGLPAKWRATSDAIAEPYGFVTEHTLGKAQALDACADELEAALTRQPVAEDGIRNGYRHVVHELLTNIKRAAIRGRCGKLDDSNFIATCDHVENLADEALSYIAPAATPTDGGEGSG